MKHFKEFSTTAQYDTSAPSLDLPNVSMTDDTGNVHVNPERGLYIIFNTTGTVTLTLGANAVMDYVEWSVDSGKTWNRETSTFTTTSAKEIWLRGVGTTLYGSIISCSSNCKVGGNIMSLLNAETNFNIITAFPNGSTHTFEQLFYGNTYITDASLLVLPCTSLVESCYKGMFKGCTSLVSPCQLPATTLAASCYEEMFNNCTLLSYVTPLLATTLAASCYKNMLKGCTSFSIAIDLPATTLATSCYEGMLEGCTGLVCSPSLPATTLATSCYKNMLKGCTSLEHITSLPATTLVESCYEGMLEGCTSLTEAPELPATTLVSNCYKRMMYGCSGINIIKAAFTTTPTTSYTEDWTNGVAVTGKFIKNANATWDVTGTYGVPSGWTSRKKASLALTIASSGKFTFNIAAGLYAMRECGWSTDGWNFTIIDNKPGTAQAVDTDVLDAGTKVWVIATGRGTSNPAGNLEEAMHITCTAPFAASGDLTCMRDDEGQFSFANLFYGSTITAAPALTDTDLYTYCYANMFKGCTSLVTPPALPATTLAGGCYYGMFDGCTGLTSAPTLAATEMKGQCYANMFKGCTSLVTPPALLATTLEYGCYRSMFNGCTGLTSTPSLPATTLYDDVYAEMFAGCTNITSISLPATRLAKDCYSNMMNGCTKMATITMLSLDAPTTEYTENWVKDVAASGTFRMSTSAYWTTLRGATWVPKDWTVTKI